MVNSRSNASKVLPKEYRAVADKLFPIPTADAAELYAGAMGVKKDYTQLLEVLNKDKSGGDFLERFQNNLDLLIQKTWVEKSDESRKKKLFDNIAPLISAIEKGDYLQSLEEFGVIMQELAWLFFGAQSQKDDFTEYALRIDAQMGLFWWYCKQLNAVLKSPWAETADKETLRALLLLGICYLTNF
jgi:hypothetical protein